MSQHPTLRVNKVGVKHRNVLNRLERVKKMQEQNSWEDRLSVYNLPKIKSMKIKVKKVKEVAADAAVPGAAAPAAGAKPAAGAVKPAAGAKPAAAAKPAEKAKK